MHLNEISMEKMQEEAKLIVLEYLNNASGFETISSGNNLPSCESFSRRSSIEACSEQMRRGLRSMSHPSHKQNLSPEILERIACFNRENLCKVNRKSQAASPRKGRLSESVISEITSFDKKNLRRLSGAIGGAENVGAINNEVLRFNKSRLKKVYRHSITCRSLEKLTLVRSCDTSDDSEIPETPITNVTRRIEEISICIMQEIPNLLDNGRSELLTPLEIEEKISYELFSSVAKSVIENKVFRLTRSVWSKVAVIFHLVKEVVFSGLLSEVEVALLVDYASRFVAENEFDDIESQGGWVAIECEHEELMLDDRRELSAKANHSSLEAFPWLKTALCTKQFFIYSTVTISAIISILYLYIKERK